MDLRFDVNIGNSYRSQSQIARILTEEWVKRNSFCPNCGNDFLTPFDNNKPVADFFCDHCFHEYELKSKKGILGSKVVDGAYSTMINRIAADNSPNFFFLTYNKANWTVNDFLIIPKHYFVDDLIEKRTPLAMAAKRAGWIGCNILLNKVPTTGRIFLVKDSNIIDKELVLKKWHETYFLKEIGATTKGWLLDVLNCIDLITSETYRLEDIYKFVPLLKMKHPDNNFIEDKIRQQLQILRDKGLLEFVSRGLYKKNYT